MFLIPGENLGSHRLRGQSQVESCLGRKGQRKQSRSVRGRLPQLCSEASTKKFSNLILAQLIISQRVGEELHRGHSPVQSQGHFSLLGLVYNCGLHVKVFSKTKPLKTQNRHKITQKMLSAQKVLSSTDDHAGMEIWATLQHARI